MSKKKTKLQIETEKVEALVQLTNSKIIELGGHTQHLHVTLSIIQSLFDKIRNMPSDKQEEYEKIKLVHMNWKQQVDKIENDYNTAMKNNVGAGISGTLGGVGVVMLGPTAAMGIATTFGVASTGTAISALSGAAATNAALAWLGGGSLASGGGGVALGTAVLSGITYGVTGGVALVTAGLIASKYFEKKLTEAKKYEAEVDKACAQMDLAVSLMDKIEQRANELLDVTSRLAQRCKEALNMFEPFVSDFEPKHPIHIKVFQRAALFIKAMSELAKTPLLDNEGNLTESSVNIVMKTDKIMNENL